MRRRVVREHGIRDSVAFDMAAPMTTTYRPDKVIPEEVVGFCRRKQTNMSQNDKYTIKDLLSGVDSIDEDDIEYHSKESLLKVEDRPRGILSNTDREYLCGLREYKHKQSESNRKQDIRDRTVNALQDFLLLSLLLDEDERNKIFDEELNEDDLQMFLEWMIAFVYNGLDQDKDRFEEIIEKGIYYAANFDKTGRWVGEATDVDASVDIEYNPDVDKLYGYLERNEEEQLTPAEIGVLVQSGRIGATELEQLTDSDQAFRDRYGALFMR